MSRNKRGLAAALVAALFVSLAACGVPQPPPPADVLTQKQLDPNRIPITVLVKNAFSVDTFEEAVEALFPEVDIVQVGNFTSDMGIAEYEARLAHDDLTDIVMTWPLDVGTEYWPQRLLDLSALPFTSRYNAARLDNVSQDGALYYLPGPSQIRGIVYNKTLFRENGWEVPADFEGFLDLCATIEASGIRSLQLGLGNAEVLDTAFMGYSLGDCLSSPADFQWLGDLNRGEATFSPHADPALETFQTLIDGGVLQPGDLTLTYADREKMIFNRQCAMIEDSVLLARMGNDYNGCTDEFGLMPFFGPDSDWARLYPVCYIGLNQHLAGPENEEKYDLVLRIMDYISSLDGQMVLMGDTGAMYSSLLGVPPPNVPEIADLVSTLSLGRCAVFPALTKGQDALRAGLAGMVEGSLTADDVCRMVDAANAAPLTHPDKAELGSATDDFSQIETGSFVTDAMKSASGSDVALFLDSGKDGLTNGKGIGAKLYKGSITAADLTRILPDYRQSETGTLCNVTMTGENLLRTLEYAIPVDNHRTGWFYYFSGLRMTFDPAAEPGARIKKITDEHGAAIDPQKIYTVAVTDHSVPEDAISSFEDTAVPIRDILEAALSTGPISPSGDGRFTVVAP